MEIWCLKTVSLLSCLNKGPSNFEELSQLFNIKIIIFMKHCFPSPHQMKMTSYWGRVWKLKLSFPPRYHMSLLYLTKSQIITVLRTKICFFLKKLKNMKLNNQIKFFTYSYVGSLETAFVWLTVGKHGITKIK